MAIEARRAGGSMHDPGGRGGAGGRHGASVPRAPAPRRRAGAPSSPHPEPTRTPPVRGSVVRSCCSALRAGEHLHAHPPAPHSAARRGPSGATSGASGRRCEETLGREARITCRARLAKGVAARPATRRSADERRRGRSLCAALAFLRLAEAERRHKTAQRRARPRLSPPPPQVSLSLA
jgi:hypothetical protein